MRRSVETSFRWGGKRLHDFQQIHIQYIQETMYQISSESSKFYRRHYKKNIWSFFPNAVYILFTSLKWNVLSAEFFHQFTNLLHSCCVHNYSEKMYRSINLLLYMSCMYEDNWLACDNT